MWSKPGGGEGLARDVFRRPRPRGGIGRFVAGVTGVASLGEGGPDGSEVDHAAARREAIERDQLGKTKLGPPTPYAGLGGYIKVTGLHEPAGALLVECHAVFDEPQGWFDGKNLLRSKLPLVVQENVRTFRRKLAKVSGEKQ